MGNRCPQCDKPIKSKALACDHHWRQLPTPVQIKLVQSYKARNAYEWQEAMALARQTWGPKP